jgi:hypothetical protein
VKGIVTALESYMAGWWAVLVGNLDVSAIISPSSLALVRWPLARLTRRHTKSPFSLCGRPLSPSHSHASGCMLSTQARARRESRQLSSLRAMILALHAVVILSCSASPGPHWRCCSHVPRCLCVERHCVVVWQRRAKLEPHVLRSGTSGRDLERAASDILPAGPD